MRGKYFLRTSADRLRSRTYLADSGGYEMPVIDPHGRIALMLCESLLYILIEEGVISRRKAMEAVATVVELSREMAESGDAAEDAAGATRLIEMIAKSLEAKRDG
jgi:hypothetical protein